MPGEGSVPRWAALLDAAAAGTWTERWPRGPIMDSLRLPNLSSWEPGLIKGEWTVDPDMFHSAGAVFGGYLAVLADLATTWAMFSVLDEREFFSTADLRVSYFRPVTRGVLRFEGSVAHRGRRMAHVECSFTDDSNRLVARGSATEVIIPLPEELTEPEEGVADGG